MADKSVRITIDGKNNVGPAVKGAKDDLAGLKKELRDMRIEDRQLRFNLGAAIEDKIKAAFGKLGPQIALIGAALAEGFKFGTWLRGVELGGKKIGDLVDRLFGVGVAAKEAYKSVRQIAAEKMFGFKAGLDASREAMERLNRASQNMIASIAATRDEEKALRDLRTEEAVAGLKASMPQGAERSEREKILRLEQDIAKTEKEHERNGRIMQEQIERKQDITDDIAQKERNIAEYQGRREVAVATKDALMPGGVVPEEVEKIRAVREQIGIILAEEEKIALTEKRLTELREQQEAAAVAITRAESDQLRVNIGLTKSKSDLLDANETLQSVQAKAEGDRLKAETENVEKLKDAQGLVEDIAAKQAEIAKEDAGKKLADNLARARRDAEALQDALSKREATGAAGSREQRAAATAEGRRMREIDRMVQERDVVGLPTMTRDRAKGLTDQQISEQRKMARLLKRLGISDAEGMSASDIEDMAEKRGVGISESTRETLRRTELEERLSKARDAEQKMQDAQKKQDELEAKLNRRSQLIELRNMNQKLETLLQAS